MAPATNLVEVAQWLAASSMNVARATLLNLVQAPVRLVAVSLSTTEAWLTTLACAVTARTTPTTEDFVAVNLGLAFSQARSAAVTRSRKALLPLACLLMVPVKAGSIKSRLVGVSLA